jgi:uncharacterized protein
MNNYYRFKEKLDNNHIWPSVYMFKFIVPSEKEEEINRLFPKNELKSRFSKNKKYISITAEVMMRSSDDVIQVYVKANKVDGVIAL